MDVEIPMGSSTNDAIGKIPIGSNPTNQTRKIGKFPIGWNPPKILWNSFESNKPLLLSSLGAVPSPLLLLHWMPLGGAGGRREKVRDADRIRGKAARRRLVRSGSTTGVVLHVITSALHSLRGHR